MCFLSESESISMPTRSISSEPNPLKTCGNGLCVSNLISKASRILACRENCYVKVGQNRLSQTWLKIPEAMISVGSFGMKGSVVKLSTTGLKASGKNSDSVNSRFSCCRESGPMSVWNNIRSD